jgi:stearoyl-CoA desaturase (delta-9 desaturase)
MINRTIPLSYQIAFWQILAHLLAISGLYMLVISHSSSWWLLLTVLMFLLVNGLGNSVGYHRLFSHNSFATNDFWHKIILMFATVGATGPSITWVALHRQHHVAPDTELDPHSPVHLGFFRVHFLSMFLPLDVRYARDLLRKPMHRIQYNHYSVFLIVWIALLWFTLGFHAVVFVWALPAVLNWHAGSLVLSWQHRGGRPHDDAFLALITCGEGYHQSHHDHPRKPRFGSWDLGYAFVHMIKK